MRTLATPLVLCLGASAALAQLPCFDTSYGIQMTVASGTADDGFSAVIPLGFTFTYGGVGYTDVQICTNGYIVLGAAPPLYPGATYSPSEQELVYDGEARVAPLWTDLSPQLGGGVWYNAVPAAGSNPAYFSVTYDACPQWSYTNALTVQVLLIDGGGIQLYYADDVQSAVAEAWVMGASPGLGGAYNPVTFESLPYASSGNPTLHRGGQNALPEAIADQVFRWTPDGLGGFVVDNGPGCAEHTAYGVGCVGSYTSFYEYFWNTTTFDLANTSLSGLFTGTSYVVTQGTATFVPPTTAAQHLALADDAETSVTLPSPLSYPGGSTGSLQVCSNGFVSTGSNGTSYMPDPTAFLGRQFASWAVWRDFNISAGSSDNVYFEVVGNVAYLTWSNVMSYSVFAQGTVPSTFQFQFDLGSGSFHIVFQNMDTTSVSAYMGGDGYLVGFSPGNGAADPGSSDLSAVAGGTAVLTLGATDNLPLGLAADARPVIGTTINLVVSSITPTAPFGGVLYGLTPYPAGIGLAGFGMPGCFQYNDMLAVLLITPAGAPTVVVPFNVPSWPGLPIQVQAGVYDLQAAQTPFGATASRGYEVRIGN